MNHECPRSVLAKPRAVLCGALIATTCFAQHAASNTIPLKNWPLPKAAAVTGSNPNATTPANDPSLVFVSITPCRLLDTRAQGGSNLTGSFGPPSLVGGQPRILIVPSSSCGVPAAQAYSMNFVSITPVGQAVGWISAWPVDTPWPGTVIINAPQGGIIDNSSIVPAAADGGIQVESTNNGDLVIDMNGYYVYASTVVGSPGPQGLQGVPGPAGLTGPAGGIGQTGPIGITGAVGSAGPVGANGAPGPIGPNGLPGAIGPAGPIGATGLPGIPGPIGLVGPTGATGAPGPFGAPGLSGPVGATGATGPAGPVGPTGPAGATGPAGPVGPAGPIGPTGPPGPIGLSGALPVVEGRFSAPAGVPFAVTAHNTNASNWSVSTTAQEVAEAFSPVQLTVTPAACTPQMTIYPYMSASTTFTVYTATLSPGSTGPPMQGNAVMSCTSANGTTGCTVAASGAVPALSLMYMVPAGGIGSALVAFSCK